MDAIIKDNIIWSLFFVMLLAGVVGGIINHFLTQETNADPKKKLFMGRDIWVGIGASYSVPLFLNMISSNLIDQIKLEPLKIYIFLGFCLIAAISSRAFINTMTNRLLKEVDAARKEAKSAEDKAKEVEEKVAPIVEKETEAEEEPVSIATTTLDLSENETKILKTFVSGSFSIRSLSGISKEVGFPKDQVNTILDDLIDKGLVLQREKEKGPRWSITVEGRKTLRRISNLEDAPDQNAVR